MAHKLKLPIKPEELPALPDNDQLGGNEMEGLLVRALRDYEAGKDAEERGKGKARPLASTRPRRSRTSAPPPTSRGSSSWTCSRSRSAPTRASCPERFRKLSLAT
jgi:hypothetical protein